MWVDTEEIVNRSVIKLHVITSLKSFNTIDIGSGLFNFSETRHKSFNAGDRDFCAVIFRKCLQFLK